MNALVAALLSAYESGEISADEFKTWFIPITWDMRRFRDPEVASMVRRVQLLLMEFSAGDRSEADFRERIRSVSVAMPHVDIVILGSRLGPVSLPGRKQSIASRLGELVAVHR